MKTRVGAMAVVLVAALAAPGVAHDRYRESARERGSGRAERMSRAEIRDVQEKLAKLGYEPGSTDGEMGARTETAIRNFQRDKGLNATGELTDETLAALEVGHRPGQRASAGETREVQRKLAALGYQPGRADGVMGEKTETALRNFQRDKGLNATGQLNDETLAALDLERGSSTAGTRSR